MRFTPSWQMLVKRRHVILISRLSITSNLDAQDFEAARKKALQVGAKKFFLEVCRVPVRQRHCDQLICVPYRISNASSLPSSSTPPSRRTASTRYVALQSNPCMISISSPICQNVYLLGTSLARPVIARGMMAIADREGCE